MENRLFRPWRKIGTRPKRVIKIVTLTLVYIGIYMNLEHHSLFGDHLSESKNLAPIEEKAIPKMEKETLPTLPSVYSTVTPPKRILFWTSFWRGMANWMTIFSRLTSGKCEQNNCELMFDRRQIDSADAVIFHAMNLFPTYTLPSRRIPQQPWIFFSLEAPPHYANQLNFPKEILGMFNWTMTYRLDSDVPIPYGRVHPNPGSSDPPIVKDYWANKTREKFAIWFVSHCHTSSKREELVDELSKYVKVDVYGKCGPHKCGTALGVRSPEKNTKIKCETITQEYMFYLSLENSICKDYVTEKFYKALTLDVVPVVLGGADYTAIAPPNSFINVFDFASPKQLADYLYQVAGNRSLYNKYFEWKNHYTVELGHPFSAMTCDLCAKLLDVNILNNSSSITKSSSDTVNLEKGRRSRSQTYNYPNIRQWFVRDSECRVWGTSSTTLFSYYDSPSLLQSHYT